MAYVPLNVTVAWADFLYIIRPRPNMEMLTTFGFFGGWPNYVTTRFRLARVQRMVYARGNQPRSSLLPETHSCKRFFVRYPPPSPSPTFIQARRTQFFLGRIHILNLRHLSTQVAGSFHLRSMLLDMDSSVTRFFDLLFWPF